MNIFYRVRLPPSIIPPEANAFLLAVHVVARQFLFPIFKPGEVFAVQNLLTVLSAIRAILRLGPAIREPFRLLLDLHGPNSLLAG